MRAGARWAELITWAVELLLGSLRGGCRAFRHFFFFFLHTAGIFPQYICLWHISLPLLLHHLPTLFPKGFMASFNLTDCCLVTKSCPMSLLWPMDCSPPGSSVHGISQARVQEWVAISSSRGIFLTQGLNLHLLHWQADSLSLCHLGSPSTWHSSA